MDKQILLVGLLNIVLHAVLLTLPDLYFINYLYVIQMISFHVFISKSK